VLYTLALNPLIIGVESEKLLAKPVKLSIGVIRSGQADKFLRR
jgi:hypothetical protein